MAGMDVHQVCIKLKYYMDTVHSFSLSTLPRTLSTSSPMPAAAASGGLLTMQR